MTEAEIKEELCRRLIEGESLRAICRDDAMPSKPTICRWLAKDEDFAKEYAAARQMQGDAYADQIIEIADTPLVGVRTVTKATGVETTEGDMVDHRRLQVEARKWVASKLYPKKYGDSTMLKHADAEGKNPVEMSDNERYVRLAAVFAAVQTRIQQEKD